MKYLPSSARMVAAVGKIVVIPMILMKLMLMKLGDRGFAEQGKRKKKA
jgi:hypothetical protein